MPSGPVSSNTTLLIEQLPIRKPILVECFLQFRPGLLIVSRFVLATHWLVRVDLVAGQEVRVFGR